MTERHMNSVQEIERAIGALTPQQMEDLYVWLDQRCPGRIDNRISRALADHKAGNALPL
jgi:hypothetical protein